MSLLCRNGSPADSKSDHRYIRMYSVDPSAIRTILPTDHRQTEPESHSSEDRSAGSAIRYWRYWRYWIFLHFDISISISSIPLRFSCRDAPRRPCCRRKIEQGVDKPWLLDHRMAIKSAIERSLHRGPERTCLSSDLFICAFFSALFLHTLVSFVSLPGRKSGKCAGTDIHQ